MLRSERPVTKDSIDNKISSPQLAAMAEWLRRWTWNPMGSSRVGSNPTRSDIFFPIFIFLISDLLDFHTVWTGYLSARKIRSKFYSLLAQVIEKNKYSGVRIAENANDIVIIIKETFKVHISPAFAWKGKQYIQIN